MYLVTCTGKVDRFCEMYLGWFDIFSFWLLCTFLLHHSVMSHSASELLMVVCFDTAMEFSHGICVLFESVLTPIMENYGKCLNSTEC
jgi:hypothetical protein